MTSGYHGSKFSGSQQSFLTKMAICIVERWEKKVVATVLFLSAVLHRQVIHVIFSTSFPGFSPTRSTEREGRGNEVGHFFSAIFAGPRFC